MRYLIIFLLLSGCSEQFDFDSINVSKTEQGNAFIPKSEDLILTCFFHPEKMPQYPGGMSALFEFLQGNLKYPSSQNYVVGKVFVSFVVDVDGSIEELEIAKGLGGEFDKAALEVFEKMPNWIPGKYYDQPIRVRMMFPITFRFN